MKREQVRTHTRKRERRSVKEEVKENQFGNE